MGALVYPVISFYSAWLAMRRWTPVRPVTQVLLTWAGGASMDLGAAGSSLTCFACWVFVPHRLY